MLALAAGCSKDRRPRHPGTTKPTFTAEILPSNEWPPSRKRRNTGSGNVTVTFDMTTNASGAITAATATFVVNASGFPPNTPINAAHIHPGVAGVNGGVLVSTTLAAGEVVLTTGTGSFTKAQSSVDPAVAQNIINNPSPSISTSTRR